MTIIIGGIDGTAVYFSKVSFYRGVKRKRLAKMYFPIIHLLLLVNEMSLSEMD
jgi:hypothetical protein